MKSDSTNLPQKMQSSYSLLFEHCLTVSGSRISTLYVETNKAPFQLVVGGGSAEKSAVERSCQILRGEPSPCAETVQLVERPSAAPERTPVLWSNRALTWAAEEESRVTEAEGNLLNTDFVLGPPAVVLVRGNFLQSKSS